MDNFKNKSYYRNLTQLIFFVIFIFLIFNGRTQLWLVIFGIGVLISIVWGRYYCGWICPINTIINIKNWFYEKLNFKVLNTPNSLKNSWLRWLILLLLVATMIISRRNNIQLNMLFYFLITGFIVSLIFDEELWHKYLCPYGAILSLTDKANKKSMVIDQQKCEKCGLCMQACPNKIIFISNKR
ncbi:MAG: 4Fe-4S binding protein [Halanaerobiales bacterium]|nr:4Fe-4S binding protein [Halanaerobiales bacterium]